MEGIVTLARADLRLITPLFAAGADQRRPELRAAAVKSALRFWYRAVDPRAVLAEGRGGPRREDRIFGGSAEGLGRSPVLLEVTDTAKGVFRWEQVRGKLDRFNEGDGKHRKNGLRYLCYSLFMRPNDQRAALPPGLGVTLTMRGERGALDRLDEDGRRAWIAALWLLGNLGSLGTRSRRGLGSVQIANWPPFREKAWMRDAVLLPNLAAAETPEQWQVEFQRGKGVLDRWFEVFEKEKYRGARWLHPHLGENFRVALLGGSTSWEEALNRAGRKLQDFRLRREPDYSDVKRALREERVPRRAPERAAFGLPLTFWYSSMRVGEVEFLPTRSDAGERKRHASLLRIRLVQLGKQVHPLFVRLTGAIPGGEPPPKAVLWSKGERRRQTAWGEVAPTEAKLLDEFMDWLGRGA